MTENIEVFTQSSIRIRIPAGTVWSDPLQVAGEPHDADFVLITHDHYDHFSPEDIAKVAKQETILIVPEKMKAKAREASAYVAKIETVKPGEEREVAGLSFETVPAYNNRKPFHPKSAGWVGYILKADGMRIYLAGDTDATEDNRRVRCDIALVPIGGTYTMDAKQAAELVNEIQPKVAIPIHYGSIVGKPADGALFGSLVKEPVQVELKLGRQP